jgi:uncharacterized tellurite resistance protein B-like protein
MNKAIPEKPRLSEHLGQLFYAIAFSDGRVVQAERELLRCIVNDRWETFGFVDQNLILTAFQKALENQDDAKSCFEKAVNGLRSNSTHLSKPLVQLISNTARKMAYAYNKLNKSELHYLARLNLEFKKMDLL